MTPFVAIDQHNKIMVIIDTVNWVDTSLEHWLCCCLCRSTQSWVAQLTKLWVPLWVHWGSPPPPCRWSSSLEELSSLPEASAFLLLFSDILIYAFQRIAESCKIVQGSWPAHLHWAPLLLRNRWPVQTFVGRKEQIIFMIFHLYVLQIIPLCFQTSFKAYGL